MLSTIFISSDNVVTWSGLKDAETDEYENGATLTMSLFKKDTKSPNAVPAVDKGGGKVGIPCTAHGLTSADYIRMEETINFNDEFSIDGDTTADEIVIVATYVAETFLGTEKIYIGILDGCNINLPYTGTDGIYRGILPDTLKRMSVYNSRQTVSEGLVVAGLFYLFIEAVKDSSRHTKRIEVKAKYDSS